MLPSDLTLSALRFILYAKSGQSCKQDCETVDFCNSLVMGEGLCSLLLLGAKHTAGSADVFATGGADGGRYARLAEPIA